MCGIFGFISSSPQPSSLILESLKTLEYRGYDSWGVATVSESKIHCEKHIGRITRLQKPEMLSTLGIGHTRWATHGGVTVKNAHPHLDCSGNLALVHNGIVENYSNLKSKLKKHEHLLKSETDTEIIVHLIEEHSRKLPFRDAVQKAFMELDGLNAILVFSKKDNVLIAAKTGSPLVIGKGKNGYYISSDTTGIINQTSSVHYLEDNSMLYISTQNLSHINLLTQEETVPVFHTINSSKTTITKNGYSHFLLKEIHEQPLTLSYLLSQATEEIKHTANEIKKAYGTFMLGCGTASHAALAGTYLFSRNAKHHVNFSIGSEFKYLEDFLTQQSLIVAYSQSGETIDVTEPVSRAKRKGSKIVAIVNTQGSTLHRLSDSRILLHAGPEMAVVATKSFSSMITVTLLLSHALNGTYTQGQKHIKNAIINLEEILSPNFLKHIKRVSRKIARSNHIFTIGRGLSYPIALEAALKIKETSYVHAEGFAGGELKHGVIALIEKKTPCIVIAPNDETFPEIISNAQEIKTRGGYIIGIGPLQSDVFDEWISTHDLQEATMIPQTVISQLLGYYIALERGIKDPDKPRNLAKSVTVK